MPLKATLEKNPVILGMFYALGHSLCFAGVSLCVKLTTAEHSVIEALFYRSFFCFLVILGILTLQKKLHRVRNARIGIQSLRAFIGTVSMYFTFLAFDLLPLSEAQSLLFAAPIFVVLLSYPLLKEKVGIFRSSAAITGFLGILLIVQPGAISSVMGGVFGLIAALGHAAVIILLRHIGKSEEALVTVFYFSGLGTLMVLPFLPFYWSPPSLPILGVFAALGILAAVLQIFLTNSYKLAPVSVIAPVTYLNLLWSLSFDFFLWGYIPGPWVFAGAFIVMTSNFVIVYRETKKSKLAAAES